MSRSQHETELYTTKLKDFSILNFKFLFRILLKRTTSVVDALAPPLRDISITSLDQNCNCFRGFSEHFHISFGKNILTTSAKKVKM